MYDFKELDANIAEAQEWLKKEYQSLRTGRATPSLLDSVQVDNYGARMPINQVATVGVEDARTLRITPWDVNSAKSIEQAINDANFGVGVTNDGHGLRITFPELTADRRESLIKMAKGKLEDARQSIRGAREDAWNDIQAQEKNGDMSEDEKFRAKDELQKKVDAGNTALESLFKKKEEEIHN